MKRRFVVLLTALLVIAGCAAVDQGVRLSESGEQLEFQCDFWPDRDVMSRAKRLYDLTDHAKDLRVDICFISASAPLALTFPKNGGYIIVLASGLTKGRPHEEMLLCSIAHELAHIDLGHTEELAEILKRTKTLGSRELRNVIDRQEIEADSGAVRILEKFGIKDAHLWMARTLDWLEEYTPSSAERGEFRRMLAGHNKPELQAWGEMMLRAGADIDGRIRNLLGDEAFKSWQSIPRVGYGRISPNKWNSKP